MISQHTYDFVEEFLKSPLKNLIKGDFVEASKGKTLEVENPSTKKIIANVAKGDAKDIDKAANAARFAFDNIWSKTKPNERQRLLFQLADLIEANAEKFALLESLDVGMPVMAAKMGLLPHIIAGLRYNAGWATKLNGETRETSLPGEWHTFTYREPMGVAAPRASCAHRVAQPEIRSCERLSFAAATIFMALVIFCVFLKAAIFRRRDCKLGIRVRSQPLASRPQLEAEQQRVVAILLRSPFSV